MNIGRAIYELVKVLSKVPPEVVTLAVETVQAICCGDKELAIRRATAAASKAASEKLIREGLGRR